MNHILLAILLLPPLTGIHAAESQPPIKPSVLSALVDGRELSADDLQPVETARYAVNSAFWSPRIKHLVVRYVPYIMDFVENDRSSWKTFARFRETAKKLRGEPFTMAFDHNWAENTVHNTFESMCRALMVDPQGDAEMIAAQKSIREGIERWVPVILAAQEPDGYLCTFVTIGDRERFAGPQGVDQHEGYQAGYFLEAAMAHGRATGATDRRMVDAARKLADLWCASIGAPPKKAWQPDHEGLEQSLARFSEYVNESDGAGRGEPYLRLAKWLLDQRGVTPPHTDKFRQKDRPLAEQQEPYGHAVMAGYLYSGAASVARCAHDGALASSADRLWDRLVNRKMYVTGGIGSSDECFQEDYTLPNDTTLGETCANIANFLFQQNMGLLRGRSTYADVAEATLYNGVLGSISIDRPEWQYFNPLDQAYARKNDSPDCCMGNIPRILLQLPTWMYARSDDGLAVNQYVGSAVKVAGIAGTDVEIVQETDYPWKGRVAVVVKPARSRAFVLRLRAPNRQPGSLYTTTPAVQGVENLRLNGAPYPLKMEKGYAVIRREWKAGDRVEFDLPLQPQRVKADPRVEAAAGRVALQYGPLVYNFESVDHGDRDPRDLRLAPDAPVEAVWRPDLLGGIVVLRAAQPDGSALTAIPNHARMNRPRRDVAPEWKHLAVTYDGTTQRVYVDGRTAGSRQPGPVDIADSPLVVGTDPFGQERHFAGEIDRLAVFDVALDNTAIARLAADAPAETTAPWPTKPRLSGGPFKLDGKGGITLPGGVGLTGNSPWSACAWVRAAKGGPKGDRLGLGVFGWGRAGQNRASFLYYVPERAATVGFFSNDLTVTNGFKAADRSSVWIREAAAPASTSSNGTSATSTAADVLNPTDVRPDFTDAASGRWAGGAR